MSLKEKYELAKNLKEEGNKLFSNNLFSQAIEFYLKGIKEIENITDLEQSNEVKKLLSILYLNISTCYFKNKDFKNSNLYVDLCLNYDPESIKALYRKAMILKEEKEYEESIKLLKRVLAIDPGNQAAKDSLMQIKETLLKEDKENKDLGSLLTKISTQEFDGNKTRLVNLSIRIDFF